MKRGQSNFSGACVGRRDACWKIVLTPFLLGGCGFRLRGTAEVPFKTVYVQGASPAFALEIKRNIRAGTHAQRLARLVQVYGR